MADETIINGLDRHIDITEISDLSEKIQSLEHEKLELLRENKEFRDRIEKYAVEVEELVGDEAKLKEILEEMGREVEKSESEKKAAEAIAMRAAQLEGEVATLQHDLILAMSEGDEANAEVRELKRAVEEIRMSLERAEREKEELRIGFEREVEKIKEEKAKSESRVCELEKRIEGLVERESGGKREREKIEGNVKVRIDEKEREIFGLQKGIEELESKVAKRDFELEKWKKEKEEMEVLKNGAENALRESEEKVKEMSEKCIQLRKEMEEAQKVASEFKKKTEDVINGMVVLEDQANSLKGSKLQWHVVAATGTVAVVAVVCYLHYARRR